MNEVKAEKKVEVKKNVNVNVGAAQKGNKNVGKKEFDDLDDLLANL